MKKFLISIFIIMMIVLNNKSKIIIPKESIRLRVIANSNSIYDQNVKKEVKNNLEKEMQIILKDTFYISDARNKINDNLNIIENQINKTLQKENYNLNYNVNFGYNYFPKKEYKGITYEEGIYESLVVTLGNGEGDNWWCVLFPPFCFIEAEESDEIEYRWKIKEILNKYF